PPPPRAWWGRACTTRRAARRRRRSAARHTPRSRRSGRAPGSSRPRSRRRACPRPASACRTPFARRAGRWRSPPRRAWMPNGWLAGVAALALIVVSIDAKHIEWRLVALTLTLWSAWGFFDSLFGSVVEPFGRFLGNALTGGAMPGGPAITIEDETIMLERLLDADPTP